MKRFLLTIFWVLFFSLAESQVRSKYVDSLKVQLAHAESDTLRCLLNSEISFTYAFLQIDSGILYAQKAISIARHIQYKKGEAAGMAAYGWNFWAAGDYDKAVDLSLKSLNLYKGLQEYDRMTAVYGQLTVYYRDAEDFDQAFKYARLCKKIFDSLTSTRQLNGSLPDVQLGSVFLYTGQIDSASFYINKAYESEKAIKRESGYMYNLMGFLEAKMKHYPEALVYYHYAISTALKQKNNFDIGYSYSLMGQLYQETGQMDSSILYAKKILANPELSIFRRPALDALALLAKVYRQTNKNDSALKYLELTVAMNDSLFNKEKSRAIQVLTFNEELQQQELQTAKKQYQNQIRLYIVFAVAALFFGIGIFLYRNNKVKQKANILLQTQKGKLESTLKTLESTQAQLIQSEKMASLGELTAGIAHEIQNPLNFINNFSEVNKELLIELKDEIDKGNAGAVKSLADDLVSNEEKIYHHGRRADAIVKGMLQHSRSGSSVKEPTDINALADEYLRLSYHGLRARDKSFNASMTTAFDPTIGKINIIPQDVGRVLLNIYNNAFYAVAEKAKQKPGGYEPSVSVSTKRLNDKIEISIKDNGNGIPQKVKDKIFQPFYTTKPTGQGTGLGLSLSYDIVKAHSGEIKVDTLEGSFTEFVIQLPTV